MWTILHFDAEFFFEGEGEKVFSDCADGVEEALVDAKVLDVKESNVDDGMAEVVEEGGLGRRVIGKGKVEDWD